MKRLAMAALASLFVLGAGAAPAGAATFGVTATPDGWDANPGDGVCDDGTGACPLRAAIMEANALPGHDTLALNPVTHYLSPDFSGPGEDGSKLGDLDVAHGLTLTTRHGGVATIDGGGIDDRVIHVLAKATVDMTNLVIRNGAAGAGGGGGVRNDGVLTMTGVEVSGNSARATGGGWIEGGGGIHNGEGATLTFTHGTIRDNRVHPGDIGGGLYVSDAGTVFVDFSTISGNEADSGGGIATASRQATIVVNNTTVSDNHARKKDGLFPGGGGIYAQSGTPGPGVPPATTVHLTNVTVSGNSTPANGGGIMNLNGQIGLINVTVTDNYAPNDASGQGAGLANRALNSTDDGYGVWLVNTIIAGNRGFVKDCATSSYIFSLGHNIDGDGSCMLSEPTDQPGSSTALLGPLRHNGGPTRTHELLPGSSAVDTGDPSWCPNIDQRRFPRPYGARCDIGAYEAGWKVTLKPEDGRSPKDARQLAPAPSR